MCNNSSDHLVLRSGYDLPIYGLHDGSFYTIHVMAISAQCISIVSIITTLVASFKLNNPKRFFRDWPKRDRFVVYMAICDGFYDTFHLADHLNVLIVRDHVYPKMLCVLFAYDVIAMFLSQILLVNIVAISAFTRICCERNMDFGRYDWRLLVWVYLVPNAVSLVAAVADKLGPTGEFCFFDGVTGSTFYLYMGTVPAVVILTTNVLLYVLTCAKLYRQTRSLKHLLTRDTPGMRAYCCAARSMVLFVTSYILQWTPLTVSGIWVATGAVLPKILIILGVFCSNLGGTLNLIVFVILRRACSDNNGAN